MATQIIFRRMALLVALGASVPASAQEHGQYRDFHLGASVAAVTAQTETRPTDVTLVHERPVVMQELRWVPSSFGASGRSPSLGSGVQQIVFSFYDNQLYRLMVDYGRTGTKGMTDRDMIDAMSAVYGHPSSTNISDEGAQPFDGESVATRVVARWNGPSYAVAASRWAYGGAWRLIIESTDLAALAQTADTAAVALDLKEGPQRQADRNRRDQRERDDAEAAARTANKATFQP